MAYSALLDEARHFTRTFKSLIAADLGQDKEPKLLFMPKCCSLLLMLQTIPVDKILTVQHY